MSQGAGFRRNQDFKQLFHYSCKTAELVFPGGKQRYHPVIPEKQYCSGEAVLALTLRQSLIRKKRFGEGILGILILLCVLKDR